MKNKIVIFLVSFVAALIFWIFVVTNVAPNTTGSIGGIPVRITGDSDLEVQSLMVTEISSETVRIELETSRAILSKLNSDNMRANVDLSYITAAGEYDLGYTITFPDTVNTGEIQITHKSVDRVHVKVENIGSVTLPVQAVVTGELPEGFSLPQEKIECEPETLSIRGPESEIAEIKRVEVRYNVTGLTESATVSLSPVFLDEDGNELTLGAHTTGAKDVGLTLRLQNSREVTLVYNSLVYGPGMDENNVAIRFEPETVTLSGDVEQIKMFGDTIEVGKIDLNMAYDKWTVTYDLKDYVSGLTVESGETVVLARLEFIDLEDRTFNVTNIELINLPETFANAETLVQNISVRLRGSPKILDKIQPDDIRIVVDLSEATETGPNKYAGVVRIFGNPTFYVLDEVELTVTLS